MSSASAPAPLPAPESMAQMIKLQSGNLLVVWNNGEVGAFLRRVFGGTAKATA